MVVDDDEDILAVIEMSLNQWGYNNVDIFSDPLRALDHLRMNVAAKKEDYALVVTDVRMPKMNGLRFAIESLKIEPDLKILFMSAFEINKQMTTQEGLTVNAKDYLRKPFALAQLCKVVREATTVQG
jgi:DNA-binding response OmpR family regulator